MTEKKLKNEILKKLKDGKTKSEVYNELKDANDDQLLRKLLASRPSKSISKNIKIIYMFVVGIWCFFWLFEFIGALDSLFAFNFKYLISFAISTYVTIQILKFNGDFFLPGIFWFFWAIINALSQYSAISDYHLDESSQILILIYILIIGSGIWLMFILRDKVFSYYNWFKPKVDSENKIIFEEY